MNPLSVKHINKTVQTLYKQFENLNRYSTKEDYYKGLEQFKQRCKDLHYKQDVYTLMSDKSAFRMNAINSSIRFVSLNSMAIKLTDKLY